MLHIHISAFILKEFAYGSSVFHNIRLTRMFSWYIHDDWVTGAVVFMF